MKRNAAAAILVVVLIIGVFAALLSMGMLPGAGPSGVRITTPQQASNEVSTVGAGVGDLESTLDDIDGLLK
ncbi:MAG: hypothetical protein HY518_00065 [Candidatus Aenigmarchaeota archaeon]|nr:hypothetical protein [Candidatus Aenigmarchaeota archaeon]